MWRTPTSSSPAGATEEEPRSAAPEGGRPASAGPLPSPGASRPGAFFIARGRRERRRSPPFGGARRRGRPTGQGAAAEPGVGRLPEPPRPNPRGRRRSRPAGPGRCGHRPATFRSGMPPAPARPRGRRPAGSGPRVCGPSSPSSGKRGKRQQWEAPLSGPPGRTSGPSGARRVLTGFPGLRGLRLRPSPDPSARHREGPSGASPRPRPPGSSGGRGGRAGRRRRGRPARERRIPTGSPGGEAPGSGSAPGAFRGPESRRERSAGRPETVWPPPPPPPQFFGCRQRRACIAAVRSFPYTLLPDRLRAEPCGLTPARRRTTIERVILSLSVRQGRPRGVPSHLPAPPPNPRRLET